MDVLLLTTKEVGDMGEETVARALETRGHKIIDRNKVLKIGEIDIISRKGQVLHIIEVKTVLCDEFPVNADDAGDSYSPVNNIHEKKVHKLAMMGEMYAKGTKWEGDWQIDAALVWVRRSDGVARVSILPNIG